MESNKEELIKEAEAPLTDEEKDENTHAHEKKETAIAYTIADLANMMLDMHESIKGMNDLLREKQGGAKAVKDDEKGGDSDVDKKEFKYRY